MGQCLGHLQVHVLKNHYASHGPAHQPLSNLKIDLDGLVVAVLKLVCQLGLDSPAHLITLYTTYLTKQLEHLIIRCENSHFMFEIQQLLKL